MGSTVKKIMLIAFSLVLTLHGWGKKPVIEPSYAWTIVTPTGLRETATIDTLLYDYYRESIPSLATGIAVATTGNLGGEYKNMVFADDHAPSDFFFRDALRHWTPTLKKAKWYNTRIPMTLLSYNLGGGRDNEQNRLKGIFSGNAGPRIQVGAMVDYLYSKGSYNYQATKDLSWGFSGSYIGERWQVQAFYNHWNLVNKENGGITDDRYITDPASIQGGDDRVNAKNIPTRLTAAHTRLVGSQLFSNTRFNFGYWKDDTTPEDTVERKHYVAVAAAFWNFDWRTDRHRFINTNTNEAREFWENTYLDPTRTSDETRFWSVSNTVGLSLIEGFNKWMKFGAAAWLRHETRRYVQTPDTTDHAPGLRPEFLTPWPEDVAVAHAKTQNRMWLGGQLTKQTGSLLRFEINGQVGIYGSAISSFNLDGTISTRFRIIGDTASVTAFGKFASTPVPYLLKNYISNHFVWKNQFGNTKEMTVGGTIALPFSGSRLQVIYNNISNQVWFDPDGLPRQKSGSTSVFTARLEQKLHVGILHWDNSLIYQVTSDDVVTPMPKFAVYSNLYLWFKIARVLQVQLGVDCDYYTRYYAPLYQPATTAFTNQRDTKVGNYPFMTAYVNMKLGKARFYVMMTHVNQGLFGGKNYFSMPGYPLNPRRFQLGVSVDFAN